MEWRNKEGIKVREYFRQEISEKIAENLEKEIEKKVEQISAARYPQAEIFKIGKCWLFVER